MPRTLSQQAALLQLKEACNGTIKLAEDDVYKAVDKSHKFHCTTCEHTWEQIWARLVRGSAGCPECRKKKALQKKCQQALKKLKKMPPYNFFS